MFTWETRKLGYIWNNEPKRSDDEKRMLSSLVTYIGILSIVGWLACIVTSKIIHTLYLTSIYPVSLTKANGTELSKERAHALSIVVEKEQANSPSLSIVTDGGATFELPEQAKEFAAYLHERARQIELIAMITLSPSAGASRAQIWPSFNVNYSELRDVMGLLSAAGFDDFDVAVDITPGKGT